MIWYLGVKFPFVVYHQFSVNLCGFYLYLLGVCTRIRTIAWLSRYSEITKHNKTRAGFTINRMYIKLVYCSIIPCRLLNTQTHLKCIIMVVIIIEYEMTNALYKCIYIFIYIYIYIYHTYVSAVTHLPRMFLSPDLRWDYSFKLLLWNSLVSCLHSHLWYSAGAF